MTEDEFLEQNIENIIHICDAMVGYECDELDYYSRKAQTQLVFGAKYRRTRTHFYGLSIVSRCKLQHPDNKTISITGCPPDSIQQTLTTLLLNQVAALVVFDIETFALQIKFESGLTLTLSNDDDKKKSYILSQIFSPHPLGGHGKDYTIKGKKIKTAFWMS